MRLGRTSRRMHSLMPQVIPTTEDWKGKNFHANGPVVCPEELYFDGPVLSSSIKKLAMSVLWRDQGWGNRKSELFVKLMRPEGRWSASGAPEREKIEVAERRQ